MTKIIGIDLGTTNSAVAVWQDGQPCIIPDREGQFLTPSIVAFEPDTQQWLVGRAAQSRLQHTPQLAISSIKRFIGRRFQDDVVQQSLHSQRILYSVTESESRQGRGGVEVMLNNIHLTPQEVSAKILQKLKDDAEAYLGQTVTQAVITVPAYFHDTQRQATYDAGRIAGLEVRRVLNEPTAACLAFGYQKLAEERKTVAVYDLGGGTFDISILEVGRGPFRVRSTNGDTFLGGDDLDWLIVSWILESLDNTVQAQLRTDLVALAVLRRAAEQAKIALSTENETLIDLSASGIGHNPAFQLPSDLTLTRTAFEALAEPLITRTLAPCRQALQDARLTGNDLREIVLVGGQTRMPAIRRAVHEFFGIAPADTVDPEVVVALGAAVQAAILSGVATGLKLADVVPLTLGVSSKGRMDAIIDRNTAVPIEKTRIYTTAEDDQESVEVQIYQGEYPEVRHNVKLGSFILQGIEPARAGDPEIEVTFRVDEDSILHVTGRDLHTGNCKELTITDSVRLSAEEIETMIHNAEQHAEEYAARLRLGKAREQAEQLTQRLMTLLSEQEQTLTAEELTSIRNVLGLPMTTDWITRAEALHAVWERLER